MLDINKDSVLHHFSDEEKLEFFQLVIGQIIELEQLFTQESKLNVSDIAKLLHKIKGTFSYFVDSDVQGIIKSLELKAKGGHFNPEDESNLANLLSLIKHEISSLLSE